ncbi:hypothetical protein GSI_07973 [Ganoderma sinense ZZ0214-1]|uniref:DUF6593 domain-containing protein n=1 Tax=Ganoderma sinense ZZ0214-1 TaxID=1077348 RepID=A0A2G8S8B4_9APHY|nr:hypothetical protein GSI_07973 [Ganoderma sinense ZZ0214-1]
MNVDSNLGHGLETTTLTLSPDDPSNTTISDTEPEETRLYTVSTRHRWNGTTTYIANVHGEVLASLERWLILNDRVILGRDQPVSLREDVSGRKYKWRGHTVSSASALELFMKDDEYAQPIARFDRPRKTSDGREEPATLTLTGRALEIQDLVVLSFVFVEHQRRKEEAQAPGGDIRPLVMTSHGRATLVGPAWTPGASNKERSGGREGEGW